MKDLRRAREQHHQAWTNEMIDLETILARDNLNHAFKAVVANKGNAGIDGMEVGELFDHLKSNGADLIEDIRAGRYQPSAVRRVYIPKENGKKRPLGIPTVVDRFVQQAVARVLSAEYETVFRDGSHGFRPKRSCSSAIDQALAYANDGYVWVVDIDLAQFFDTVSHGKLLQVLSKRVKDRRVIKLVHKMLRAPVSENGVIEKREIGTPQGGPVSPVLANILLHELDMELEARGHKYVRYADDLMVLCRSRKAAERTLERIRPFIEGTLFLRINVEKTKICHIAHPGLKFLGFGFWQKPNKEGGSLILDRPHRKSQAKCKARLKELTSRSRGQSLDVFRRDLRRFVVGWMNYFGRSSMKAFIADTDRWLRRRIRMVYWKQWKKPSMRIRALRKLGISDGKAYEWGHSRKGYWRIAGSWVLATSLTNDFLRQKGWICLQDAYRMRPAT